MALCVCSWPLLFRRPSLALIPLCICQDTSGNAKQRCRRWTSHYDSFGHSQRCTLFASEIDDCLWICCFSCPFNQMALNDDRDLRWMQEIYFQTFSQCVPCPPCVFFLLHFAISPFAFVVAVDCVRQCVSVSAVHVCARVSFFFVQFALAMDVFRLKMNETKRRNKNRFYP